MEMIAEMMEDTVEMYKGSKIPFVIKSDHPRFNNGTRLNWGFLQVAIEDGYTVTVKPFKINKSNCKHPNGFERTCMIRGGKDVEREYRCRICHATQYIPKEENNPELIKRWRKKND